MTDAGADAGAGGARSSGPPAPYEAGMRGCGDGELAINKLRDITIWLVVWNIKFIFPLILGMLIIPIDNKLHGSFGDTWGYS